MQSPPGSLVKAIIVGSALTYLSGCAVVPDIDKPLIMLDQKGLQSAQSLSPDRNLTGTWPGKMWWTDYGDKQLNALIVEALAGSPDLAAAKARLRKAVAASAEADASLYPSVKATGALQPTKQSYYNGVPIDAVPKGWNNSASLILSLSYEIDLFGKNLASRRASLAEQEKARIAMFQSQLSLSVAVANTWASLLGQNHALIMARQTVSIREHSLHLVSRLHDQGMETQDRVSQAKSELATARAQEVARGEDLLVTRHQMAALLGKGPDRGLSIQIPDNAVIPDHSLPGNINSDLLAHRPDVISARYQAESAAQRIKIAHANFYPSVNLAATIGQQALGLGYFDNTGSRAGSWGPSFTLPVFEGGALRARYREANADYDEAVATYNQTLVEALQNVADVLTKRTQIQAQLDYSREALKEAESSWALATRRYEGGLATYLDVLTAENTLISAREQVNTFQVQAFQRDIAVNQALGGGFTSAAKDK